jgi:hypothetical protein
VAAVGNLFLTSALETDKECHKIPSRTRNDRDLRDSGDLLDFRISAIPIRESEHSGLLSLIIVDEFNPYFQLSKISCGTARLGYIFEVNREFGEVESPVVDRTGFEPVASSLQMRRSTN